MYKTDTPKRTNPLVIALATAISLVTAFAIAADEDVILQTSDFKITEQDFNYYLVDREIDEETARQVFAREGMVKNAIENLYVIKAFASQGAKNTAIDMEEVEWLVAHYRDRLLMNRHLDIEIAAELENTNWEAVALEEYMANRKNFVTQEMVDADHILIDINDRSREEAHARAEQILQRLRGGEDFATLAQEFSDDVGSKATGGKLGPFPRELMVPTFEVAAFELKNPGELSEPVETDFGYHIIRLNARIAARQQTFDEVKELLIPDVKLRHQQQVREFKMSAVKTGQVDLGLEVNLPLLEAIEARYDPKPDTRAERVREVLGDD
jgi:peptidyl-prolyl cis-trans isomerase C